MTNAAPGVEQETEFMVSEKATPVVRMSDVASGTTKHANCNNARPLRAVAGTVEAVQTQKRLVFMMTCYNESLGV